MLRDRTSPEETKTQTGRRRSLGALSPALLVALVAIGLLVLRRRRTSTSKLEPPF